MLDDDAFEKLRGHAAIPDTLRIHHDDRATGAHAEARRLAAFHAMRPEQKALALQKPGEGSIERAPLAVRRAEAADAHEDVARVRLHDSGGLAGWSRHDE